MSLYQVKEEIKELKQRTLYDKDHWMTHQSRAFKVSNVSASFASGAYVELCFKTPTTRQIHVVPHFTTKDAAALRIYEDCTWSGGQTGTQVNIIARNRLSTIQSTITDDWRASGAWEVSGTMKQGVSGMSGALVEEKYHVGSQLWISAETRGRNELILKTGMQYCVRLFSAAAGNAGQVELDWYEANI